MVTSDQTLLESVTLVWTVEPPVTMASLRLLPMPTAQPSTAGSPWEAMPACWPRLSRFGLIHSSSVRLVWFTGPAIVPFAAIEGAVPASTNGAAAPRVTPPE